MNRIRLVISWAQSFGGMTGSAAWVSGRFSSAWPLGRAIRPTARWSERARRAFAMPNSCYLGEAEARLRRRAWERPSLNAHPVRRADAETRRATRTTRQGEQRLGAASTLRLRPACPRAAHPPVPPEASDKSLGEFAAPPDLALERVLSNEAIDVFTEVRHAMEMTESRRGRTSQ